MPSHIFLRKNSLPFVSCDNEAKALDKIRTSAYNNGRYITSVIGSELMAPKQKISKDEIIAAAFQIVRESGETALNARAVAAKLGCSTQPVFSNYASMERLRADIKVRAEEIYGAYLEREIAAGKYPPYKASGIGYIRFAREEPKLFELLYMCDRRNEKKDADSLDGILDMICASTGYSRETALRLHLETWSFVHGIAVMLVTNYLEWDWELISSVLTDVFTGLKLRFAEENHESH